MLSLERPDPRLGGLAKGMGVEQNCEGLMRAMEAGLAPLHIRHRCTSRLWNARTSAGMDMAKGMGVGQEMTANRRDQQEMDLAKTFG